MLAVIVMFILLVVYCCVVGVVYCAVWFVCCNCVGLLLAVFVAVVCGMICGCAFAAVLRVPLLGLLGFWLIVLLFSARYCSGVNVACV